MTSPHDKKIIPVPIALSNDYFPQNYLEISLVIRILNIKMQEAWFERPARKNMIFFQNTPIMIKKVPNNFKGNPIMMPTLNPNQSLMIAPAKGHIILG